MKKIHSYILVTVFLAVLPLSSWSVVVAAEITLAAANSTCATLKKAGAIFSRQQGVTIHYMCKSSGMLAKGLETGYVTADYFISADQQWMDYLVDKQLVDPATVTALWDNVIIAVALKTTALELQDWSQLATSKISAIFVGDPSRTPLGRQFKNAMITHGLWQDVRSKIVAKQHVSQTRDDLLTANDTTIGIVFPTDLGSQLKPLLNMPTDWHAPIRYYSSPLVSSKNKEEVACFDAFLKSEMVNELFLKDGYRVLSRAYSSK